MKAGLLLALQLVIGCGGSPAEQAPSPVVLPALCQQGSVVTGAVSLPVTYCSVGPLIDSRAGRFLQMSGQVDGGRFSGDAVYPGLDLRPKLVIDGRTWVEDNRRSGHRVDIVSTNGCGPFSCTAHGVIDMPLFALDGGSSDPLDGGLPEDAVRLHLVF